MCKQKITFEQARDIVLKARPIISFFALSILFPSLVNMQALDSVYISPNTGFVKQLNFFEKLNFTIDKENSEYINFVAELQAARSMFFSQFLYCV